MKWMDKGMNWCLTWDVFLIGWYGENGRLLLPLKGNCVYSRSEWMSVRIEIRMLSIGWRGENSVSTSLYSQNDWQVCEWLWQCRLNVLCSFKEVSFSIFVCNGLNARVWCSHYVCTVRVCLFSADWTGVKDKHEDWASVLKETLKTAPAAPSYLLDKVSNLNILFTLG